MIVVRVRGYATAALDSVADNAEIARGIDSDDADVLTAVAKAYARGALRFERAEADAIARGLIELANSEDAYVTVHDNDSDASEMVSMARHARDGLSTLARSVRAAAR